MSRFGKYAILATLLLPALASALSLTRPLSLGSEGSDVTSLQQVLQTDGYLSVAPTGYFGPLTQAAVEEYQSAKGIVSSGSPSTTGYGDVGPKTLASLNGTPTSTNPNQPLIDQLLAEVKALEAQIAAILAGQTTTTPSTTTGGATAGASGITLPPQASVPPAVGGGSSSSSAGGSSSSSGNFSSTGGGGSSGGSSSPNSPSVCPKGTGYQDGCTSAPVGTPQYPGLLSPYTTRPQWNVAGVDYIVGPQPNVPLKDPATINTPGVTIDTIGKTVTITGNNVVLNGYDFTIGGPYNIVVKGANDTIENFKIAVKNTAAYTPAIEMANATNATNLTIEYGIMDGLGSTVGVTNEQELIACLGQQGITVQYVWFKQASDDAIQLGGGNDLIQYNLFDQAAYTTDPNTGLILSHADAIQQNPSVQSTSTIVQFNTYYQGVANAQGYPGTADSFAQLTAGNVTGPVSTLSGQVIAHNTVISLGRSGHRGTDGALDNPGASYLIQLDSNAGGNSNANPQVHDNYVDASGSYGWLYPFNTNNSLVSPIDPQVYNNVDLTTGQQFASPNTTTAQNPAISTNSCPKGTSYQDGCSAAPSGIPQYPSLLSSYVTRAPWNVAGVDYAVGPQPGVALKDPSTINMPGVSLDPTHHWILITGNNVTLDGYDFTLGGGWTIVVDGAQNTTLKNFKAGVVAGSASPPIQEEYGTGTNNLVISNCVIDGGGPASSNLNGGDAITGAGGSMTVTYCWLKNFTEGGVAISIANTASDIRYNLFDSAKFDYNFHSQFINAPQGSSNVTATFNTFYQPLAQSNGFPGFMVAALNDGGYGNNAANITGVTFNNNTGVGLGATGHSASATNSGQAMENWINFTNSQKGTNQIISPQAQNNYVTMSGTLGYFAYPLDSSVVSPTLAGNINMETGQVLTQSGATTPPPADTTPPTVTITGPSGQLAANIMSTNLTVTTNEAATCAWSNTAGTAFASMTQFSTTGGTAHSTTLSGLTNGSSYTTYVKCKDAAGNTSQDSSTSYSVAQSTQSTGGTTSSSCAQATAFLSRVSVDAAHQTDYTNLICGLVTDGIWNKLDVFYVFATQNSSAALANLVSTSFTATANGTPSFAADSGYTVSSGNFISSNYNFATNGTNFTQNSASFGGWSGSTAASYQYIWGDSLTYSGNEKIKVKDPSDGTTGFSINDGSAENIAGPTDASGMFALVRLDANTEVVYRNGAMLGSVSHASVAPDNGVFETGGDPSGSGNYTGTIRAMFAGGALSTTDVSNLYSLLSAYMQAVGATP